MNGRYSWVILLLSVEWLLLTGNSLAQSGSLKGVTNPWHRIKVSGSIKTDLYMWLDFLKGMQQYLFLVGFFDPGGFFADIFGCFGKQGVWRLFSRQLVYAALV